MYEYNVTIQTDRELGQFFDHSLEQFLETPDEINDQVPSEVNVEFEKATNSNDVTETSDRPTVEVDETALNIVAQYALIDAKSLNKYSDLIVEPANELLEQANSNE